jgi:hypothetical protein
VHRTRKTSKFTEAGTDIRQRIQPKSQIFLENKLAEIYGNIKKIIDKKIDRDKPDR